MDNIDKIPAFIINRNLLTWPKLMIKWMEKIPEIEPIIFDNNSSYAPLLEWYEADPCQIIRMPFNSGHIGIFQTDIFNYISGNYYIIADPDFDMTHIPLDVIDKMKYGLEKYTSYGKCGLAIHIDDLPDAFPGKYDIINWEQKYWEHPLEDDFYLAHVDTTFALYDKRRLIGHTYEAIRIAGPYTARHIPWYLTKYNMSDEFLYYCEHNEGPANICGYCASALKEYKEKNG
jgi:hypothetical protein